MSKPHMQSIAKAYGINRAYPYELSARHGMTAAELCDPDLVFQKLIESGRGCPLRSRLSNPANRESIRKALQ